MNQHFVSLSRTGHVVALLAACVLLAPGAAFAAPRHDIVGPTVRSAEPRNWSNGTINSTSGNTVANWSSFLDEADVSACAGPQVHARMAATMNIAVFDALNAIAPRSPQIAFHGRELAASPRAAVASASRTSLVEVLRSAPGLSADCRQTSIAFVERAAAASMATLPDRPGSWIGVVLGKAAANAALSWTGTHPAVDDLVPMRLVRVDAEEHGMTMWETAALLTDCSTTAVEHQQSARRGGGLSPTFWSKPADLPLRSVADSARRWESEQ
jgi:hypothetical protein